MKKKKHIPINENFKVSFLAISLIREIDNQLYPLFKWWNKFNDQIELATFNPVRIIMPLIEVAAEIEYKKAPHKLLEKLQVPESEIAWSMYRHGLSHSIRPYYIMHKGIKYNWGIRHYETTNDMTPDNIIMISPLKLLASLKTYLEGFISDDREISIQMGAELSKE